MNTIEVVICSGVDSGELLAMLEGEAASGAWESGGEIHLFWPEDKWGPAVMADLERAMATLGIEKSAILKVSPVPDQDWNAAWASSLQPIVLGHSFRIRQSWHEADSSFKGTELVIDPKRAFGTGYHATTQLVTQWLERHIRGGEILLDVGTGSGILSMAAIRLGAAKALAIDNDPVALDCAREYCVVNGFGPELELRVCSFEDIESHSFNVIVANLDILTVPKLCPHLPRLLAPGAIGCISGIQLPDSGEIETMLSSEGIRIESLAQNGEWIALSIKNG